MLFFELLFEDAHLLAVNKPSGIPAHSLREDLESETPRTVEAHVLTRYPDSRILHRLDTGTSGVLLFAKNDSVYQEMREKFKLKLLKKHYRAWSDTERPLPPVPVRIDAPLGHHPKSAKRMVIYQPEKRNSIRGKPLPAVTLVHAARRIESDGLRLTELDVEIVTGVTHQIRVHLRHFGFPLLGDALYNVATPTPARHRLGLHAHRVAFTLRGWCYEIQAPLPRTFDLPATSVSSDII